MKTKKLSLDKISVDSFITSIEKKQSETLQGGDLSLFACPGGVSLSTCIPTSEKIASMCGRCSAAVCNDTYDTQNAAKTCNYTDGAICNFFTTGCKEAQPISALNNGGRCPGEM